MSGKSACRETMNAVFKETNKDVGMSAFNCSAPRCTHVPASSPAPNQ